MLAQLSVQGAVPDEDLAPEYRPQRRGVPQVSARSRAVLDETLLLQSSVPERRGSPQWRVHQPLHTGDGLSCLWHLLWLVTGVCR